MQSFRNLKVWEKAHAVTIEIYTASRSFPKEELYGSDQPNASSIGFDRREHCRRLVPEG